MFLLKVVSWRVLFGVVEVIEISWVEFRIRWMLLKEGDMKWWEEM